MIFIPVATDDEIRNKSSWVNTGFDWPRDAYQEICYEASQAIYAWSRVELTLFGIYTKSIKSTSQMGAQATWSALDSFRARREITSAAHIVSGLAGYDQEALEKLSERCRKKSLRRNQIAHGQLFYDHKEPQTSRKFFISTVKIGPLSRKDYTSDARALSAAFMQLTSDLFAYYVRL
jgi:hypothetical protein